MSNTEFEFFRYFSEMLECSICSDTYINPRKLPCSHTFCLKCLEMSAKHVPFDGKVCCPLCRNESFLKQTVSDLPDNMLFSCMADIKRRIDGYLSKYDRAICSRQSCTVFASWQCTDCDLSFCETCMTNHDGSHKVVSLETFLLQTAELCVRSCLQMIRKQLKSTMEAFALAVSVSEDEITKKAEELKSLIDEHKNRLMIQLHSAKQDKMKNCEAIHKEVESLLLQHSEDKQKQNLDDLQDVNSKDVQFLESVKLPCLLGSTNVRFLPHNLHHGLPSVGSLPNILGELSFAQKNLIQSNCELDSVDSKTYTLAAKRTGIVVGLSTIGDKLYVIHSLASNVDEYDNASFRLITSLPIKGLISPQDMAACQKFGYLYITDSYDNTVSQVEVRQGQMLKWPVGDEPHGISVSSASSHVFVTCLYSQRIYEFTSSGDVVRCLFLQPEIAHPRHAIELETGEIALCHGFWSTDPLHRVSLIDGTNGRSYRHFGDESGSAKDQLNQPMHLATSKNGFIAVADSANNRIQLLNSSLTGVVCITDSLGKMKSPHRLCLDVQKGLLYVAENTLQNQITVFQLRTFLP